MHVFQEVCSEHLTFEWHVCVELGKRGGEYGVLEDVNVDMKGAEMLLLFHMFDMHNNL